MSKRWGEEMRTTNKQLKLAGWLSIVNGLIALPVFGVCLSLPNFPTIGERTLVILLDSISLGIAVYALLTLKGLLNSRFRFTKVDVHILLLIGLNAAIFFLNILSLNFYKIGEAAGEISSFITIILGINYIVYARKLLSLTDNLYGLLRIFSWGTIIAGACYASMFLVPLGIFVGIAAYITLGMIFLRAAGPEHNGVMGR